MQDYIISTITTYYINQVVRKKNTREIRDAKQEKQIDQKKHTVLRR
jgi:hypothetical protein